MSELNKNQKKAFNVSEKLIESEIRQLKKIYKSSLTDIKTKLIDLDKKGDLTENEMLRYQRLEKLNKQILNEVKLLESNSYNLARKTNTTIVNETYNRNWFGMEKETGASISFGDLNPEVVKGIVTKPYPGVSLKDFFLKDGADMASKIKLALGLGLSQGEGPRKIASRIKKEMDISFNRAVRIARTEGLTAHSKASMVSDQKAIDKGIKIIRFWDAALDNRTRNTHRTADGQSEDKQGNFTVGGVKFIYPRVVSPDNTSGNTARERINCRCSVIKEIEDVPETMKTRAEKQKKEIDGLSYEEWKKGKGIKIDKGIPKVKEPKTPKVTGFKPAKTIQEGEEIAKQLGVKYPDYSKMTIEHVNEINKSLAEIRPLYRPKYITDMRTYFNSTGQKRTRNYKTVYGLSSRFSAFKYKGKHIFEGGEAVALNVKDYKTFNDIAKRKKEINKFYKERHGNDWFLNTEGKQVIKHELGHKIKDELTRAQEVDFKFLLNNWKTKRKLPDMMDNINEAFAETWAAYKTGKTEDMPKKLIEFLEQFNAD
jgi:hypothetical protein